jgi:hypothetical protein
MAELKKCRACGVDVPSNALSSHCPQCLLELSSGTMPKNAVEAATIPNSALRIPHSAPSVTSATTNCWNRLAAAAWASAVGNSQSPYFGDGLSEQTGGSGSGSRNADVRASKAALHRHPAGAEAEGTASRGRKIISDFAQLTRASSPVAGGCPGGRTVFFIGA